LKLPRTERERGGMGKRKKKMEQESKDRAIKKGN
jgi:hypothetical protein